jgi:hypothetical protein
VAKTNLMTSASASRRKVVHTSFAKSDIRELPDIEEAAARFLEADLPWLKPKVRRALAALPEVHGRLDGKVPSSSAKKASDKASAHKGI